MTVMREIYLDYAAATPLDPRVREAMEPYLGDEFGNPSSIHAKGRAAKKAIDDARGIVARILGCKPDEIVFTSGGTEAINLAIFGVAHKFPLRKHVISTKIEHHAVLRACEALEREQFEVSFLDVDAEGIVAPAVMRRAVGHDTLLVAFGYANNEIGTIQPVAELAAAAHERGTLVFVDACQAAGLCEIAVARLGVDMMALDSSKFYGPKGAGCLYIRKGIELEPMFYGGGQERGVRSGTENVAGIVGFAKALEIAEAMRSDEVTRLAELRDYFIAEALRSIPGSVLNGPAPRREADRRDRRMASNIDLSFAGIEGEAAVVFLDKEGIRASTGAACSSVEIAPSHVVRAIGRDRAHAAGSLRFTLGRATTREDIDAALAALRRTVATLSGDR